MQSKNSESVTCKSLPQFLKANPKKWKEEVNQLQETLMLKLTLDLKRMEKIKRLF